MNKQIKTYIAGHNGLVGSAIIRNLKNKEYNNLITRASSELDLRITEEVFNFFESEKPEWVFLAAAKVGGIYANNTYPVDFLLDNLKIQNNIIEASYKFGVKKLIFLGSSCIYPQNCPQPIKEDYLLTSTLEPTNEPYALAKITGIKLCSSYNRQYKTNFMSVMPCNLYGINDNYHNENGHVIPMLIRRFHEAKVINLPEVEVWGSGAPRREFMSSDDLASACLHLIENYNASDIGEFINIGIGFDITIKELVDYIKEIIGYNGKVTFNKNKPDGTMMKLLDVNKINSLGWKATIELKEGIKTAYTDYLENSVRK